MRSFNCLAAAVNINQFANQQQVAIDWNFHTLQLYIEQKREQELGAWIRKEESASEQKRRSQHKGLLLGTYRAAPLVLLRFLRRNNEL